MDRIIESVPNVSEGRDLDKINAIVEAIRRTGAKVLSAEPEATYNRTVITLVGNPDQALDGAFACVRTACQLIDMRVHHGEHPRIGAADVVPFVPVRGVSMSQCAALARKLGRRIGDQIGIPVYLYGDAARKPDRQDLAVVRRGEYEGLVAKLADRNWAPDFGPTKFVAASGATIVGARPFLIAYNINLDSRDVELANRFAQIIRTSGRRRGRDDGPPPGLFPAVKALGFALRAADRELAQVSVNLVDYTQTNMHVVYEKVRELANAEGVSVTGSEIVGLVPLAALAEAGRFYGGPALDDDAAAAAAVAGLGLNDLAPFDASKKILERLIDAAS